MTFESLILGDPPEDPAKCLNIVVAVWYVEQMHPHDVRTEAAKERWDRAMYEAYLKYERAAASRLRKHLTDAFGRGWLKYRDEAREVGPEARKRLLERADLPHSLRTEEADEDVR